jgi:hypothetical protein
MTKINELMALADEYANGKQWSSKQYTEQKRQELVMALEAALKPSEPVLYIDIDTFNMPSAHVEA